MAGRVGTHGLRLDVNCSILLTGLPLERRPAAAKAAGFDGVELWWPWAGPEPAGTEADALLSALADAGTELACLNFLTGDIEAGERGLLSVPAARDRFRANIPAAVEIAARAGCTRLNAPYGTRVDAGDAALCARQDELALEHLQLAAAAAGEVGATVLIEPINSRDVPGYPIDTAAKAAALARAIGAPNVGLLADLYHLAMMEEDLPAVLARYAGQVAHVQLADAPGRGAPGTGAIAFEPLLAQLAAQGYAGWVGLEYVAPDPAAAFGWL